MKKLLSLSFALTISLCIFAQCDPATIKDNPSIYSKETSYKPTPEQEKWVNTLFTSVLETSFKSTKGLRGTWKPMGDFPATPEGFIKSEFESYLFTMGCKDNKPYNKDEEGLILKFDLNGFNNTEHSQIANICSHEETRWEKFDDSKTLYIDDLFEGKLVYFLKRPTQTAEYASIAFYRKTEDAEYFVITKPGIPLFIPVSIRQVLEINRKNYTNMLEEEKKHALMPGMQPETKADYEKRMAKDFAAYRESIPNPEAFITDLIIQLEETKLTMIKQQQFLVDFYTKNIALVTSYLKNTPANKLDKPCISVPGLMFCAFGDTSEMGSIQSFLGNVDERVLGSFVTINPAYFNKSISKTAPQFISIELRIQGGNAVALKAYNDFKTHLDLDKLQSLLVK